MKKTKIIIIPILIALILISIFTVYKTTDAYADQNNRVAEIVMEVSSGRVLHAKNEKNKMFMASTTKILTAITVIDNCNLDEVVVIPKQAVGIEGSSIYLEEGEKLTVEELLYGLMLRSGNDAAVALALHVSGSIEKFAELMNEKAISIGATNSNFINPHGLHNDNHFTTAYDLALISSYAIKNPAFKKIVSTKTKNISWDSRNYDRILVNKNKMLKEFEGSIGIKTGYTKKAGRCLVSACERNGMQLICVVLNCPPMFERSKELLSDKFNAFEMTEIINSENILDFIPVKDSDIKCGVYTKDDIILPLSNEEKEKFNIVYNYPKELYPPLKKDEEIGQIEIYIENKLIFSQKVFTIIKVD